MKKSRKVCHNNRPKPARRSGAPQKKNGYMARNTLLKTMGYKTYAIYLKSPLWRSIRDRVLAAQDECFCCGGPPLQIHHRRYDRPTLEGRSLKWLVALCIGCHGLIERDGVTKLSVSQAEARLVKLRAKRLRYEAGEVA